MEQSKVCQSSQCLISFENPEFLLEVTLVYEQEYFHLGWDNRLRVGVELYLSRLPLWKCLNL